MHIGGDNMRTTLDLPKDLLEEAMKATHLETKTKVIITALEELIRKTRISELKQFKGKIDLDIDLNTIRGRQCRY
ncbi:MAG: type II toxin-antitoxin system VapB family antitoxin [Desulfurivibrionaceae bacterium]|jgi:Arc/MetJ family transcription regulator